MKEVIVFTDGGSKGNPGPGGIGVVIYLNGQIKTYRKLIGEVTNNQAEYEAVIFALKKLKQLLGKKGLQTTKVILKLDSELVGKQIRGEYRVLEPELKDYFLEVYNLKFDFPHLQIDIIPREQNKLADALVKSMFKNLS